MSPQFGASWSFERVCHSADYLDLVDDGPKASHTIPIADLQAVQEVASQIDVERAMEAAVTFAVVVPLVKFDAYRNALIKGLVVSVGGLTETTKEASKAALLTALRADETTSKKVSEAVVHLLKDTDNRLAIPLIATASILLSSGVFCAEFKDTLQDNTFTLVRTSIFLFSNK